MHPADPSPKVALEVLEIITTRAGFRSYPRRFREDYRRPDENRLIRLSLTATRPAVLAAIARQLLLDGCQDSRAFDNCLENSQGTQVIRLLALASRAEPVLALAISGYRTLTRPDEPERYWRDFPELYHPDGTRTDAQLELFTA